MGKKRVTVIKLLKIAALNMSLSRESWNNFPTFSRKLSVMGGEAGNMRFIFDD